MCNHLRFPNQCTNSTQDALCILPGSDKKIRHKGEFISATGKIILLSPPSSHINIFEKRDSRRMHRARESARQKRKCPPFTRRTTESHKTAPWAGARRDVPPVPDLSSAATFAVSQADGYSQHRKPLTHLRSSRYHTTERSAQQELRASCWAGHTAALHGQAGAGQENQPPREPP